MNRPIFRLRRALTALFFLSCAGGMGACTDLAADSPLSNARATPEELADVALEALSAGDRETLQELLVNRDEYEHVIWPILPDGEYVTFEFVWGISAPRNRKALRQLLGDYTGVPMELVSVDLGDEVEEYEGLTLYKEARMTVRRTDDGREGLIPMMDVLVHMDGGWKFLNYDEDL